MSAYCYQVSRFQSIFHDKDDLGLHEDVIKWWVDFVYFTNLPFSLEIYTYLYNDNVINVFFNIIDWVPLHLSLQHFLVYRHPKGEAMLGLTLVHLGPPYFTLFPLSLLTTVDYSKRTKLVGSIFF